MSVYRPSQDTRPLVSWFAKLLNKRGTRVLREQKKTVKSFKKQNREGIETEEKDKQWTLDIFTQPVEKASESFLEINY